MLELGRSKSREPADESPRKRLTLRSALPDDFDASGAATVPALGVSSRRRGPAIVALAGALLLAPPVWANHFSSRRVEIGGQEQGIVASHGMDLFRITTSAGGYTPARRAEIIAGRLEELSETHEVTPEMFSVGFRNGEVIIQQQEHTTHLPHIVVTVDRGLARQLPGARGSVERLAEWWLALLRDHLCLAVGRLPVHTTGTPVGATFEKLYARLGHPRAPVPAEAIDRAFASLTMSDQEAFRAAARAVPESYSPDRVIVVYAPPAGPTASHHEEGGENEAPSPSPAAAPPERSRTEKESTNPAAPPAAPPANAQRPAAPADKPPIIGNVRRAGRYEITLTSDPAAPEVGPEMDVDVEIVDTAAPGAPPGRKTPLADAAVRGWFLAEGQELGKVRPQKAHPEEDEGVYGWHVRFTQPGRYRLVVEVTPPAAERFDVEFPISVAAAGAAGGKDEPAAAPTERSPSDAETADHGRGRLAPRSASGSLRMTSAAGRAGAPRDRVRTEMTPDGYLEVAWQPPDSPVKTVTFTLLDAEGKPLETYALSTPPFTAQFPRPAKSYLSAGLAQIQVAAEYASGVRTEVVVPFEKPSSDGKVRKR